MLWVRSGSEWWGPYPDRAKNRVYAFARIGSQKGRRRTVMRGRKQPTAVDRVYIKGQRAYPTAGLGRTRGEAQLSPRARVVSAGLGGALLSSMAGAIFRPSGYLDRLAVHAAAAGVGGLGTPAILEKMREKDTI